MKKRTRRRAARHTPVTPPANPAPPAAPLRDAHPDSETISTRIKDLLESRLVPGQPVTDAERDEERARLMAIPGLIVI